MTPGAPSQVSLPLRAVGDDGPPTPVTAHPGQAGYSCRDVAVTLPGARGGREILCHVDLEIRPGEIVTIVGRSGTGKTTLLRVLGGLTPATAGTVLLGGAPVSGPPENAVTVFQDYGNALLPWRTVRRNVALGLEGRGGLRHADRDARVAEALAAVGLSERADDHPWRLSGGMQQRVQIARALALRPSVLLMDEPFGALDAMTKASLQDELLALHARASPTIVFITHDVEEALYLGDRLLVIAGQPGRIEHDIRVDLPRPRHQLATRELPRFLELRHRVHETIGTPRDA